MNVTCPHCGKEFEFVDPGRKSGGVARWKGVGKRKRSEAARKASLSMSPEERRESNRRAAAARWAKARAARDQ